MAEELISGITADSPERTSNAQTVDSITFDKETSTIVRKRPVTYARVREIRKDPTVNLARLLCVAPILACKWTYESDEDATPEELNYVNSFLRHHRALVKAAALGMVDFGFAPFEVCWELSPEGYWVPSEFVPLLQDITSIKIDGGRFVGFVQKYQSLEGEEVQSSIEGLFKALLFAEGQEGANLYGEGPIENLDATCESYDNVLSVADAYDRKTAGAVWIVRYPVGSTEFNGVKTNNFTIANTLLSTLKANGNIAIPTSVAQAVGNVVGGAPFNKLITSNDWEIELKESSGTSSTHMQARAEYLDKLKVRALGLPERSMLEGRHGTLAEAEAHADVALTVAIDRVNYILEQLNKGPVLAGTVVNFGPDRARKVRLIAEPLTSEERTFLRGIYTTILQSSDLGLLDVQNIDLAALRDIIGIPSVSADATTTPQDALDQVRGQLNSGGTNTDPTGTDNANGAA